MSFYLNTLLARRILREKGNRVAKPVIRLSVFGVSLGILIMLMAIGITSGYKKIIGEKVVALGQHICISHYDQNYSYEQTPITFDDALKSDLKKFPEIVSVQPFATKVGIVKTENQVEGVVLKGIDKAFDGESFTKHIVEGYVLQFDDTLAGNGAVISKKLADKLMIKVGDKIYTYFVQDPPRQRSFSVVGIYETGLPEFDSKLMLVDIRHVQKLNDWSDNQVSGVEILTDNFENIDEIGSNIHHNIDVNLQAKTIKQTYPEIFDWIALFDTNVMVLLIITTCVCMITMMSVFFIIILEQTRLIGILKTLGMKTREIVITFMIVAADMLVKGLFVGNLLALGVGFLQQKFHFVKLNPDTYYVSFVPVHFDFREVLLLNAAVFVVCMLVLIVPAFVVGRKISPVKSVRFD